MIYRVSHTTLYHYSSPAALSQNEACLEPREVPHQRVLETRWQTTPEPDYVGEHTDFFGNRRRSFSFERPHQELALTFAHRLEVGKTAQPSQDRRHLPAYLLPSPYVPLSPAVAAWASDCFLRGQDPYDSLQALTAKIHRSFVYDPKATSVSTRVEDFFALKRGVCQDFSQLMISALRGLGIPARYVSGYLNTLPPPGKEKILGADASHAWVSAYLEGSGWVDMDPTNGIAVEDHHITISWGRDYGDVSPLKGVVLGGGAQTLKVEVSVEAETP